MTAHFDRELELLKKRLLALAAVVEETVQQAVHALETSDRPLAHKVLAADDKIDSLEVELEEECLKALALYQPVASDLRYIVAILKINNDLERIGDLAGGIVERALSLADGVCLTPPFDVKAMAVLTQRMLGFALDALVKKDLDLAKKVLTLDDEVDEVHARNFDIIKNTVLHSPEQVHGLMSYLTVSRHLERIADLATNIAEDVIYMINGEIVRHLSHYR